MSTPASERALASASSIASKKLKLLWIADQHDVIRMILALKWELFSEAASTFQLSNHIPPHGCRLAAAEGIGIANQDHAMLGTRQKDIDTICRVQKACLPQVIASDEGHQNDLALLTCNGHSHMLSLMVAVAVCGGILYRVVTGQEYPTITCTRLLPLQARSHL